MTSSDESSYRNLMFGIIAWQKNIISEEQLLSGFRESTNQAKPLKSVFLDQGVLPLERSEEIDLLVEGQLQNRSTPELNSASQDTNPGNGRDTRNATLRRPRRAPNSTGPTEPNRPTERFRIIRQHAKGGLGEVFVAMDTELKREVALKEIQVSHAHDRESQTRFTLEAEITGSLEHPGIVPIYSAGTYADGRPYYAMRFIHGDSMEQAIEEFHTDDLDSAKRNLQLRQLLNRFVDVCDAVAYAHNCGVLHRDLKPSNVMLGSYGETLVVDWGLARRIESNGEEKRSSLTESAAGHGESSTLGSPGYMSPEQVTGEELGPAADVYSMGATLYHILTGRPSQTSTNLAELVSAITTGRFPKPRELDKSISKPLEAICLKALELKPSDRYENVSLLAADVEKWLADEPVSAYRDSVWTRLQRRIRRRPAMSLWVAFILLFGGASACLGAVEVNNQLSQTTRTLMMIPLVFLVFPLFGSALGAGIGGAIGLLHSAYKRLTGAKPKSGHSALSGAERGNSWGVKLGFGFSCIMAIYSLIFGGLENLFLADPIDPTWPVAQPEVPIHDSFVEEVKVLEPTASIHSIAIAEDQNFAATAGGILRFDANWQLLNEQPIPIPRVKDIWSIDTRENRLWAGVTQMDEVSNLPDRILVLCIKLPDFSLETAIDVSQSATAGAIRIDESSLWISSQWTDNEFNWPGIAHYDVIRNELHGKGFLRYYPELGVSRSIRIADQRLYSLHGFGQDAAVYEFDTTKTSGEFETNFQEPIRIYRLGAFGRLQSSFDFVDGQVNQLWSAEGRQLTLFRLQNTPTQP